RSKRDWSSDVCSSDLLGTVTTSSVVEALLTVASVPLKVTVFSALVALKLVPEMVTVVPTAPSFGLRLVTVSCLSGSGVTIKEGQIGRASCRERGEREE